MARSNFHQLWDAAVIIHSLQNRHSGIRHHHTMTLLLQKVLLSTTNNAIYGVNKSSYGDVKESKMQECAA